MIFTPILKGQTTLEEYNYVTKGYKNQIESGLDMKKGYEFANIDTVSTRIATAEMKILYRIKDSKKEIAAYLIIYRRTGRTTEYICVPNPKSDNEIMGKYMAALWDGYSETSSKGQLISFILSKHLKW
jgi:hypothetical protein